MGLPITTGCVWYSLESHQGVCSDFSSAEIQWLRPLHHSGAPSTLHFFRKWVHNTKWQLSNNHVLVLKHKQSSNEGILGIWMKMCCFLYRLPCRPREALHAWLSNVGLCVWYLCCMYGWCPKSCPFPYIMLYGPWSKVVHYVGNRVPFGGHMMSCISS
jgi:hypothetical protein